MKGGISTACLYPMETSESLAVLLSGGHTHFEIFFNTYREIQPDYISRLSAMLEEKDASVRSIHPFTSGYEGVMLFSNYETRFEDSLDFYRQYCRAAKQIGAEFLILHGMQVHHRTPENEKRYFHRYRELYRMAKEEYGITVAQENVTKFFSEEPGFIARLRDAVGNDCAFCFDLKQAVRTNVDCYEMLEAMGDKLVHIHLNDNKPGETCLLPGQGNADLAKVLQTAKKHGFDGSVIVEVYRTNFKTMGELKDSAEMVAKLIENSEKITNSVKF